MSHVQLRVPVLGARERLWQLCATAQGLACWQADEVTGSVALGAQLRLRWPTLGRELPLRVVALEPGSRIAFSSPAGELELQLLADELQLRFAPHLPEPVSGGWAASWRLALELARFALSEAPILERRVRWYLRESTAPAALLYEYLRDPTLRATWFPPRGHEDAQTRDAGSDLLEAVVEAPHFGVSLATGGKAPSVLQLRLLPTSPERRLIAVSLSHFAPPGPWAPQDGSWDTALQALTRRLEHPADC